MVDDIQAVIWDMGGVLIRGKDHSPRECLAQRLGMECAALEDLVFNTDTSRLCLLGNISEAEAWDRVGDEIGLHGEALAQARKEFFSGNEMDAPLVDLIDNLRPRYKTGLLSNAWAGTREALGAKFSFLHVFDVSLFSDEEGMIKPDAAFYHLMLERLDVTAEHAVFIDDKEKNVIAARELGMAGIHFRDREQMMNELVTLLPGIPQG